MPMLGQNIQSVISHTTNRVIRDRDRTFITVSQTTYKATHKFCLTRNEDYFHPNKDYSAHCTAPTRGASVGMNLALKCKSFLRYLSNAFKH